MSIRIRSASTLLCSSLIAMSSIVNVAHAGAREEGRLLTATEVLEEVRAMPDVRLPDTLLAHAYGIAVIPDVTKVAFIFGGRHGSGVLAVYTVIVLLIGLPAYAIVPNVVSQAASFSR